MSHLYASLFYQADVTEIFSDHALLKYMIQAEVALATAQAQLGVIPESAAAMTLGEKPISGMKFAARLAQKLMNY